MAQNVPKHNFWIHSLNSEIQEIETINNFLSDASHNTIYKIVTKCLFLLNCLFLLLFTVSEAFLKWVNTCTCKKLFHISWNCAIGFPTNFIKKICWLLDWCFLMRNKVKYQTKFEYNMFHFRRSRIMSLAKVVIHQIWGFWS